MKGGGGAPSPPTSPARANFSVMMECTPEIGPCLSLHSVGVTVNLLMTVTEGVHCTLYMPQSNNSATP
jgi:hypothetical protein